MRHVSHMKRHQFHADDPFCPPSFVVNRRLFSDERLDVRTPVTYCLFSNGVCTSSDYVLMIRMRIQKTRQNWASRIRLCRGEASMWGSTRLDARGVSWVIFLSIYTSSILLPLLYSLALIAYNLDVPLSFSHSRPCDIE